LPLKRIGLPDQCCFEYGDRKHLHDFCNLGSEHGYSVREVMKRIHGGEIGRIVALQNYYNASTPWVRPRQPEWNEMQYQMRNWYFFTWLGGDHIVEQAVHSIDKMAWAMQDFMPDQAIAHGGRQVRTGEDYGHIFGLTIMRLILVYAPNFMLNIMYPLHTLNH